MPVVQNHESLIFPDENLVVAKYMDLTKFISMLQRQCLFFCRLDILQDKFEGTAPKLSEEQVLSLQDTPNEFKKNFRESLTLTRKLMKNITCVNCWNIFENESAALWKIYSDDHRGIMIKSSIHSIVESFKSNQEGIFLSLIKYIDYAKDTLPIIDNAFVPMIHKQKAYSFEEEVRLFVTARTKPDLTIDWSQEETPEGVFQWVDLNLLISEIIISPYAPKWFSKLVLDLMDKYNLRKDIRPSELSTTYE